MDRWHLTEQRGDVESRGAAATAAYRWRVDDARSDGPRRDGDPFAAIRDGLGRIGG